MLLMPRNAPPAFHVMAKPAGAACNLACQYCFYLDKERLYPSSRFRMPDEVLRAYIEQLLASHQAPEVTVAWQGGEPTLMGLDFFRRSVELVERHRRRGQKVVYTLQTNGTRLDEEWCAFFKEHGFLVGLSIDGPPALHNAYRVDKGGRGSFDQALRGWDLLRKHNVDANVLCTVHAANASRPLQVYRFLRDDLEARFIQYIPIVERQRPEVSLQAKRGPGELPGGERPLAVRSASPNCGETQAGHLVSERSVKPKQYGRFLVDVFEEWVRHDVGKVFVQMFDAALANWYGEPAGVCIFQPTCGLALVLEHNGDLYYCDHFVEPGYRLGNILDTPMIDLVTSPRQRQFGLDKRDTLPRCCRECHVRFACHGECPRNRFLKTPRGRASGNGEGGLNYLCEGYKLFFHHVDRPMRIMATMLRRRRAPAEIMQIYAAEDARRRTRGAKTGHRTRVKPGQTT